VVRWGKKLFCNPIFLGLANVLFLARGALFPQCAQKAQSAGGKSIHPTNPSCQYFHETIALLKKEYARRNQNSGYVRPC